MPNKHAHPHAVIGKNVVLGNNVSIGPFVVIGDNVTLGDDTVVDAGAQVLEYSTLGKKCHVFAYAVVGGMSQDLKYKDCRSFVKIGDGNTIREFVTINRGTDPESSTVIGNNNHIMAYSHIAHDCIIGDNNIFANCATLAGHVHVESHSVIGGLAAVHQFCRVGELAIIGGCSKVVQDVAPYSICDGHPAVVRGLNLVGLRRANFTQKQISLLKNAYKIAFFDDHPFDKAVELIKSSIEMSKEVSSLVKFLELTKRGIAR
jgi:UDP-N-acetylglucosamine acyltransferase